MKKTFESEQIPYIALCGNKSTYHRTLAEAGLFLVGCVVSDRFVFCLFPPFPVDLQHMRAVKADKHAQFADDNQLYSYFVSAKSGDHVQQAFYRIAADLAGIVLSKAEIDQKAKIVQAEIINHPQHDPNQEKLVLKEKESKCTIQ